MNKKNIDTPSSRRKFIKQAAWASVGAMGLRHNVAFAQPTNSVDVEQEAESIGFAARPVLANVSHNSIEVIVAPSVLATGWVEYGETPALGYTVEGSVFGRAPFSDRVLRFHIRGLEAGKEYFYRVHLQQVVFHTNWRMERTTEIRSELNSFRTLNPEGSTATFTCWNDTHENEETLARLAHMLHEQQPDFLLWNGDVTNDIFREEQLVGQFLNPGGQAYATSTPMMLARGNHDVRGRDAPYLQDYLTGPGGEYHFGFRQGPMACLVMDTGEDKPDDHIEYGGLADFAAYRSMQAEWLEQIIEEPWFKSAPFRIVFMHIPLVWEQHSRYREWDGKCTGWICEDAYDKWHNLLVKAKVQLVISGHTHRHNYIPPTEERTYGQLVGGGPQPDRATCITGHADASRLVVTMVDLDGNVLEKLEFTASI